MKRKGIVSKGAKRDSSLHLSSYFVYHKKNSKKLKLPESITEPAKLQITAKFWALLCCSGNPASKNTDRTFSFEPVLLARGWGRGLFCMMSSGDTEGANQTLRKLCHLLLSSSIQAYRSAVNCELRRGHFFLPTAVHVCEKKKKKRGSSGGKRGGRGRASPL